jgi:hypothetical protein
VYDLWILHKKHLATSITNSWQECARLCQEWTIHQDRGLEPCAMWSWQNDPAHGTPDVPAHTCLLGQEFGLPTTTKVPHMISGCDFGSVCNQSLPIHPSAECVADPMCSFKIKAELPGCQICANNTKLPWSCEKCCEGCTMEKAEGGQYCKCSKPGPAPGVEGVAVLPSATAALTQSDPPSPALAAACAKVHIHSVLPSLLPSLILPSLPPSLLSFMSYPRCTLALWTSLATTPPSLSLCTTCSTANQTR